MTDRHSKTPPNPTPRAYRRGSAAAGRRSKAGRKGEKLLKRDAAKISWVDRAACANMPLESFFVTAGRAAAPDVIAICQKCPVRRECLEHAYVGGVDDKPIRFGYFAGLSPDQRRRMSLTEALNLITTDTIEDEPSSPHPAQNNPVAAGPVRLPT